MNKRRIGRMVVWLIPILMIMWGSYQLIDLYQGKTSRANASRMLYEASQFQIELMSRFMSEAQNARTSAELNAVKNAVYSASFVHDRLVRAYPAGQIDGLESLAELLQYILHLQIGGDRPLKEEERETLHELEPVVTKLAEAYGGLMTERAELNRYERSLLKQLDDDLSKIVQRYN